MGAHPGRGLAGGISVCGPDGHSGLDTLAPYLASISDLDTAAAIVVAGDTELSQRAPVVELRIRKAVTGGAKVITVGVGGTRLETLRGAHHISTAAGTAHATLMTATDPASELGGALAGAEQVVVIWNGRVSQAAADILAHLAHSLDARVLITPAGNELGAHAAGLGTHSPSEALEAVESGQIKAIVLLGADPVGDWTNGERWRGALARAQFVLQVTAFQNDSSGWATTIVPASESLEQEGTVTNLEGRVQRLRAAATPPARRAGRLRLDGRAGRAARPGSPLRRGPGVHRAGPIAHRIRRHVVVVAGRAGRAARASTGILHPGRAAAGRPPQVLPRARRWSPTES